MGSRWTARLANISILSCLGILIANIIHIRSNPVDGYVESMLTHIGWASWLSFVAVFFLCSFGLLYSSKERTAHQATFAGIILLNNAVILFAPYISGAFLMNGGDLPTHGGMVLDILVKGRIDFESNFYPFTHILATVLCDSSGSDYMMVVRNLAPLFSLLVPSLMYLIARVANADGYTRRLAFVLGSGFYFSSLFQPNSITAPNGLSLMFLPFLVYLMLRRESAKLAFSIPLTLCMTAFTIFHPITSLVLVGGFILIYSISRILHVRQKGYSMLYYACASVGYLVFLTSIWTKIVTNMSNFLLGYRISPGYAVDISENLAKLGLDEIGYAALFIKMFGHQVLLLLLSAIFFAIGLSKRTRNLENQSGNLKPVLIATFSLSAIGTIMLAIQIAVPTFLNFSFFRSLVYTLTFTPLFCSFLLGHRATTSARRIAISLLAVLLFVASMLVLYPSPYINEANTQVTYEDAAGASWILEYRNESIGLSGYFGSGITIRLASWLIPYSEFSEQKHTMWVDQKTRMPDHLGYQENGTLFETLEGQRYLIITYYDIVNYEGVYAHLGRVTCEDVDRALEDYTSSLVYDNGQYMAFLVE